MSWGEGELSHIRAGSEQHRTIVSLGTVWADSSTKNPSEAERCKKALSMLFEIRLWCQRNYFSLSKRDVLWIGWEEFFPNLRDKVAGTNPSRRYFSLLLGSEKILTLPHWNIAP